MQTCIWLNHRSSQEADALIPVTVSCTYPHGVSTWTYTFKKNKTYHAWEMIRFKEAAVTKVCKLLNISSYICRKWRYAISTWALTDLSSLLAVPVVLIDWSTDSTECCELNDLSNKTVSLFVISCSIYDFVISTLFSK